MKIGILCHSSVGGSARIGTELACELSERGHRVHLFARTRPFGFDPRTTRVQVHAVLPDHVMEVAPDRLWTSWPPDQIRHLLAGICSVLDSEGLDILHFHYALPFAFVLERLRIRLGARTPVLVGTLHGTDVSVHGADPFTAPLLTRALACLDAVTTVSHAHARLATRLLRLSEPPMVIPDFVDLARFELPRGVPTEPPLRRRPRIAHVSNFRPVKNPELLAQTFVAVARSVDAELWLIGDGEGLASARRVLDAAGLAGRVRHWGFREDVAPILQRCDLLLVTSDQESFCLAALEAMACGVPVVGRRLGGLPEVVQDGESGLLVSSDQPLALAEAVIAALRAGPRRRAMQAAARRRSHMFARRRIVAHYEALYMRLLAQAWADRAFQVNVWRRQERYELA